MSALYEPEEESELYCYDVLPTPSSIRIAKIIQSPDHEEGIYITLRTVDLDENPKYDALSYTWGHPRTLYYRGEEVPKTSGQERESPIICDGKLLFVTRNLCDFLECCRTLVSKLGPSKSGSTYDETGNIIEESDVEMPSEIWIDAICINQEDVLERNAQVAMMSRIYNVCRKLWIWLGRADPLSQGALSFALHLAMTPLDQGERLRHRGLEHPDWNKLIHASRMDWWSIYALFHRAWFHRAWIVQEVVFSKQLAILTEHAIISWGMLFGAAKFLFRSGLDFQIADFVANELEGRKQKTYQEAAYPRMFEERNQIELISTLDPNVETAVGRAVYQIHEQTYSKKERGEYDFLALLHDTRDSIATDPRDKIFATLGLAERNCHRLSKDVKISLPKPDYRKPTETVFLETAWYILEASRNLEILCHIQDRYWTKLNELPSWVPDWSTRLAPNRLRGPSREHQWSASSSIEWKMPAVCGTEVLQVQGTFVDRIVEAATINILDTKDKREHLNLSDMANIALSTPKVYPWAWGRTKIGAGNLDFERTSFQEKEDHESRIRPLEVNVYPIAQSIEVPMAQSRVEALWRTLIADTIGHEHPAPIEFGFGFGSYVVDSIQAAGFSYAVNSQLTCQDPLPGVTRNTSLEYTYKAYTEVYIKLVESELNCRAPGEDPLQIFQQTEDHRKHGYECGFPATGVGFIPLDDAPVDEHGKLKKLSVFEANRMVKFKNMMYEVSVGRRLFRTARDFLGNGPRSLEVNDQVWVLAGVKVPLILRPLDTGRYQVIGQAYVHGIMHGEALRFANFKMVDIALS